VSADGIVIGLDPSLTHFGFAVGQLHQGDLHFVETGVWATKPGDEDRTKTEGAARRCTWLAEKLFTLIAYHGRPALLATEGLALPFGKTSMQTISTLGRVRGLVDAVAASQHLTVREFAPAHLKRLITGSASADKAQVRAVVEATYPELTTLWPGRQSDIEHAADAVAALHAAVTNAVPEE
jgi:Holliday junction resolvasome RuvABC endonuclease subunit